MDDKTAAIYPHRQNSDLSYDSICPICFATVSSQKIEAELAEYEQHHVCKISDLFDLYQRDARSPVSPN